MKPSTALTTAFSATRMIGEEPYLDTRSMDSTIFANFQFMAQYSAAGYCNKEGTVGEVVSCKDSICSNVVLNGVTLESTFDCSWYSTGGVLLKDPVNKAFVVAFAGTDTSSVLDYILDLDIVLEDIDLCDGCKVHSGFHIAWEAVADEVLRAVTAAAESENYEYSITFTGHSLGAAVATIGCATYRASGGGCELYTFGSPRVGNMAFAEFVSAQAGNEYRMTHLDDPVPRLPGHALGYYHTDVEYWLYTGTATTGVTYTAADVNICTGVYNTSCNSGGIISTDFAAHSYYLRHISVCS